MVQYKKVDNTIFMKIILLQDIAGVGAKYDVKNVSDGYARNFLFARKLAARATPQEVEKIEKLKKQTDNEKELQKDILEKNIKSLEGLRIEIKAKANEKGHLFSIIHADDMSRALKEQHRLDIPAKLIETERPIKELGEYKVKVKDKEFILEAKAS